MLPILLISAQSKTGIYQRVFTNINAWLGGTWNYALHGDNMHVLVRDYHYALTDLCLLGIDGP